MAKQYPSARALGKRIDGARSTRRLSYARLGQLAQVNGAQAWRICRGEFATLNPSVLRICSVLRLRPDEAWAAATAPDPVEAQLAAEAIAAWDRTEAGAELLTRVLRAFRGA